MDFDLAKTARNVAIARVAWAFARDRLAAQVPGVEPRKQRSRAKTLLIGGGIAAVLGAALLKKREAVRALLPGSSDSSAAPAPESYTPPPVSNYDASGPVTNTATSVPVPPAHESPALDETEEEAAAAAEAANIGGPASDYAGPAGEPATESERPLAESGEGESEGQEQAELDLARAAEPTAPGMSDTERQIEDTIEAASNPATGEQVEPVKPVDEAAPGETASEPATGETAEPVKPADEATPGETASEPATGEAETEGGSKSSDDDPGGSDWQTWSGRSVNP